MMSRERFREPKHFHCFLKASQSTHESTKSINNDQCFVLLLCVLLYEYDVYQIEMRIAVKPHGPGM
jgi:hypothetical protein